MAFYELAKECDGYIWLAKQGVAPRRARRHITTQQSHNRLSNGDPRVVAGSRCAYIKPTGALTLDLSCIYMSHSH